MRGRVKSLCSLVEKKMEDLVKNRMYTRLCPLPPAPCLWPSLQESRRSQSQITLCIKKRLVLEAQILLWRKFYLKKIILNIQLVPTPYSPSSSFINREYRKSSSPKPDSPYNTSDFRCPAQQVVYALSGNLYRSQILSHMRDSSYTHLPSLFSVPC